MLTDYEARYDAIVGPWVAVMVDGEERPPDVRKLAKGDELAVAVVRRAAAPATSGGDLPHGGRPEDTAGEIMHDLAGYRFHGDVERV
ncbi:hypothetical protein [Micromonospora sp. NPDC005652]|uniref:hypothetical protein n=1 Tax=Micromonospora sp. NPDC005652 TaxID=3157046 RepID=UPI0033D82F69